MERVQGRFERRLTLGAALDVSRARAELHGGLLRVTIPRLRERRGSQKSIPIERGA